MPSSSSSANLSTRLNTGPHAIANAIADGVAQSAETINIQESDELARWVRALGVSEEQLRMAVAAVGAQVEDVRNHFGVVRTAG